FLLSRVEMVIAGMHGYTDANGFPYIRQQGVGAALGFALIVLLQARRHLAPVVRAAFGTTPGRDQEGPRRYRAALFVLRGSFWLVMLVAVDAGMRPLTALYYLALLLVIVMVVARLRAEVGLPTFEFFRVGAEDILNRVAGTAAWSRGDLAGMSLFFWL